jgi:hypothetical protein
MGERVTIGCFGDPRREERGAWIMQRTVACGSLTVRTIGETRAGEIAVHRFLDCPDVTADEIITTLAERTAAACSGRRIVAVQDTTEINFRGRDHARRGLGRGGDGVGLGFFLHPLIAVDAADAAVLGLFGGTDLDPSVGSGRLRSGAASPAQRGGEGIAALAGRCCHGGSTSRHGEPGDRGR